MKNLSWIILFPLAVVLIVFAVSNRGPVSVDLWPLSLVIDIPLFVLMFAALLAGIIWGGVATWRAARGSRKLSRSRAKDVSQQEIEINRLKDQISRLEASAAETRPDDTALQIASQPATTRW